MNQLSKALVLVASWARRQEGGRSICPPQLLRFATHLILFLDEMRLLGRPDAVPGLTTQEDEEARSIIIGAYIRHLIAAGHVRALCKLLPPPLTRAQGSWIAFYTARLRESVQVDTYVEYIATLKQTDGAALTRAKEAGLDARAIALKTASRATDAATAAVSSLLAQQLVGTAAREVTSEEEEQIRAVEWLSVSPTWLHDLLLQTNKLARSFLCTNPPFLPFNSLDTQQ